MRAEARLRLDYLQRTVIDNPHIPWVPNPKQAAFLTEPCNEILYGGAAGGGKSVALLMAALQFVHVENYSALLLRRTFADLNLPEALVPLSHQWLQNTRAAWDGQRHQWRFPNGAAIQFGYLETEIDKYRYQGAAFPFVGFDELTQFTESQYRYLFSRIRRAAGIKVPLRMRAASNPGGVGHEWVKQRFIDHPASTKRMFIPAWLADNPKLDVEAYRDALAQLDPVTRAQLESGDWNITASRYFKLNWLRYYRREGEFYRLITGLEHERIVKPEDCMRFLTADVAGTEKAADDSNDPDYSVFAVWDLTEQGDLILVDIWRDRCEEPEVVRAGARLMRQHDVQFAIVEKNGLGTGVVSTMRHKGLTVLPVNVKTSKVTRAQTAMVRMHAGMIFLNVGEPLLDAIKGELVSFDGKNGHDDIVDAFSLAAIRAQQEAGAPPVREDAEAQAKLDAGDAAKELELIAAGRPTRALEEYGELDEPERSDHVWDSFGGDED